MIEARNIVYDLADQQPVRTSAVRQAFLPFVLTARLAKPSAAAGGERSASRAALLLPIVAFAAATALSLTVLGGLMMFIEQPRFDSIYILFAGFAAVVLFVPLLSLGGAAARLSARRRDDRLSTLRLLGASSATVAAMTILESAALALIGALAGIVLYLVLLPIVGLLSFGGGAVGSGLLLLSPGLISLVVCAMVLLSAISALLSIRTVVLSPLGVRMRTNAPPLRKWMFVIVAAIILLCVGMLQMLSAAASEAMVITMVFGAFGAGIAVLNLLGPLVIGAVARFRMRRAQTIEQIIGLRQILESPKAVWRQVGGVAITSFVAVIAGSGLAITSSVGTDGLDSASRILMADTQTGVYVTIVISFVMVACAVGVSQAAAVYDRAEYYRSLSTIGMPLAAVDKARRLGVIAPLRWVMAVSLGLGCLLVFPLVGMAIIFAPVSIATMALFLAGGVGLVWLGLWATRPLLRSLSAPA
ncbi:FtsX-like permease family protein [Lysinibacter cavernae]|uniref:ABC3 transporter permease C-terminal domain-containing protein n=1 Tax=Lysinibacter cavernae TaxID=1640652 RepID=A0A7X5R0Q9_9MICO|nr:FtsX-like permease family protein [Lysinibacter cavernae]NIH53564.1 hypothetical protein [Lysinibacter cavernae]